MREQSLLARETVCCTVLIDFENTVWNMGKREGEKPFVLCDVFSPQSSLELGASNEQSAMSNPQSRLFGSSDWGVVFGGVTFVVAPLRDFGCFSLRCSNEKPVLNGILETQEHRIARCFVQYQGSLIGQTRRTVFQAE